MKKLLSLAISLACYSNMVSANPNGASIVNGHVSISNSPGVTNITNSPNAIINWQGFNIQPNEITRFIQQNSQSTVLNRVIGHNPSQIMGQLLSNGRIFLINPNGIVFGANSVVDTKGFLASTLNLSNTDFLQGNYHFIAGPTHGDILNEGIIRTGQKGNLILIAPNIHNRGIISTEGGRITLAAGERLTITSLDNPMIQFEVQAPDNTVLNLGKVLTTGGAIDLFGGTIQHSGEIRADSLAYDEQGQLWLQASADMTLTEGSITSANNAVGDAGSIHLENSQGLILSTGVIQANSTTGQGGHIQIEGDWAGLGGQIEANGQQGGSIHLNTQGLSLADQISATGSSGQGGQIQLQVAQKSWESSTSRLDVSGHSGGSITHIAEQQITSSGQYHAEGLSGQGGNIDLSAPATKLLSAQLNADGATAGGRIRLGGEFQGGKALSTDELPNAQILAASSGTVISAKALSINGSGGEVIIWSDLNTVVYADVSAQQGSQSVAAGLIEISSGEDLFYAGSANAGIGGEVLFDPKNITISNIGQVGAASQFDLVLGFGYETIARFDSNTPLEANDFFSSVSLSGTRLAIGARGDDGVDNSQLNRGAVYLFSFADLAFNSPTLEAVLGAGYTGGKNLDLSTVLDAGDAFGTSLALSGNTLAVGASGDDGFGDGQSNSGAVRLFSFSDAAFSTPVLESTLGQAYVGSNDVDLGSVLAANDNFGAGVALDSGRLAGGAIGDDGAGINSGAVLLFSFADFIFTTLVHEGTLGGGFVGAKDLDLSGLLNTTDQFGGALSLSGNRLAVGAEFDDGDANVAANTGAVHLFSFADNKFTTPALEASLGFAYAGGKNLNLNAELENNDRFGSSVSLDATQLAVGASRDEGLGNVITEGGAVYLISFADADFNTPALESRLGVGYSGGKNLDLTATIDTLDRFGISVSLDNNRLAVGAESDQGFGNNFGKTGAVHLFSFADAVFITPVLEGTIGAGYVDGKNFDLSSALTNTDAFGESIALNGNRLAVGAQDDGFSNAAVDSGAVYLFSFADAALTSPVLQATLGVGYIGGNNLDLSGVLEANDLFNRVSLDGNRLAVGATGDAGFGNVPGASGAVYLFSFADDTFSTPVLEATLGANYTGGKNLDLSGQLDINDDFGFSVALDGNRLAVGARRDDGFGNSLGDSGAVYLLSFADAAFSTPVLEGILGAGYSGGKNIDLSGQLDDDFFGFSVSLKDNQLAVGAPLDDGFGNTVTDAGAVYLFNFADAAFTTPQLTATLGVGYTGSKDLNLNGVLDANDTFGSVSLDNNVLAVGAQADDGQGNVLADSGAVYLLTFADALFSSPNLEAVLGVGYVGSKDFSLTGTLDTDDRFGISTSLDGGRLATGASLDDGINNSNTDTGAVYLFDISGGLGRVADANFNTNPGLSFTLSPGSLTDILNTGANVTLQANNDITISNAINVNNSSGNGGNIVLQAGRSILINADIVTDNGNFSAFANQAGAVNANREAGDASILMATGTTLNAGTGDVNFTIGTGDGLTFNQTGLVNISNLVSNDLTVALAGQSSGIPLNVSGTFTAVAGSDINLTGGVLGGVGLFDLAAANVTGTGITLGTANDATNAPTLRVTSADLNNFGNLSIANGTLESIGALAFSTGNTLNISGGELLISAGALSTNGTLNWSGGNIVAASGFTLQSGGQINLSGNTATANLVLNGGNLGGTGSFTGNLINTAGTLAAGNSPGTLNIIGNLTLGANSTTEMDITGLIQGSTAEPGGFDFINVTGAVNLGGLLNIVTTPYVGEAVGDSFNFIQASAGISGDFSSITTTNTAFQYSSSINRGAGFDLFNLVTTALGDAPQAVIQGLIDRQSNDLVNLIAEVGDTEESLISEEEAEEAADEPELLQCNAQL